MSGDLIGRVALVTGSVAGIGRAITEVLAARGAAVVAHSLDASANAAAAAEWRERGWRCTESDLDLGQTGAAGQLHASVRDALGAPDILVLSASIEVAEVLSALTPNAVEAQFAVNVASSCFLLQACLPDMASRGWGRVVAIGSVQEERPNASHLVYAGTKAALTSIVLNLARNERSAGLTFNVVRPGAIETDRNRVRLAEPGFRDAVIDRIPSGRIGIPEDCAAAVSLLCSDAGAYMNGSVIAVDGGMRL